jgi:hypothetical protein
MRPLSKRPLTIREILDWATRHKETTGKWPSKDSGEIPGSHGETWSGVDAALRAGTRNLPAGSSIARLVAEKRGARNFKALPRLTEPRILELADAHRERTGELPTRHSGAIPDCNGDTWESIDNALLQCGRGLTKRSSLSRLLAQHRGYRNRKQLPKLTEEQILAWAGAHHDRTGKWPSAKSGPIVDAPGETWLAADMALRHSRRGLPGGSSLALLLAEKRGVRNIWTRPNYSREQILAWADSHRVRTGRWPHTESGPIPELTGENWAAVDRALKRGLRGLPAGSSLAKLLAVERGVRSPTNLPLLSQRRIIQWATAHHQRTGRWPTMESTDPIPESQGDTWMSVDVALKKSRRGLKGVSSLARLLEENGKKPNRSALPPLSHKKILAWSDAYFARTGRWPNVNSGPVAEAPSERWEMIDQSLRVGSRHLPGGSSLIQLLARKRGVRNPLDLPALSVEQILSWADAHCRRTGERPKYNDGPILDAPGETWAGVDSSLRYGKRNLPASLSLAKLLNKYGR